MPRGLLILFVLFHSILWGELSDIEEPLSNSGQVNLKALRSSALPLEFQLSPVSAFKTEVEKRSVNLEVWGQNLLKSGVEVLCLGETHSKQYRDAIATRILPLISIHALHLEMTKTEKEEVLQRFDQEDPMDVDWLGAPMGQVLQVALQKIGRPSVYGIEQSDEQKKLALMEKLNSFTDRVLSRDGFIAHNFVENYQPGGLNLILYGANHCSYTDIGLPLDIPFFHHLKNRWKEKAKSVYVVFENKLDHPLVSFLKRSGLGDKSFVLENFSQIHPKYFNYRSEIMKYQSNFDVVIYLTRK